jgi:hypothetical protein
MVPVAAGLPVELYRSVRSLGGARGLWPRSRHRKIRSCGAPLPASGVPNPYVDARGCHAIELLADVSSGFTQMLETENRWDRRAKSSRAHYAA